MTDTTASGSETPDERIAAPGIEERTAPGRDATLRAGERSGRVVALVPDLMDRSRLGAHQIEFVGAAALLPIAAAGAALVLVDLSRPGVPEVLDVVVEAADRVVGYAPHVEDEVLALAVASGVEALPRSLFFRRIGDILAGERAAE
jgi:hypothetical protein